MIRVIGITGIGECVHGQYEAIAIVKYLEDKLVGKVGSVIASSGTQHGGQETTITSFHTVLLHQGMVVVGLPYSFQGQSRIDEITGCSPDAALDSAGCPPQAKGAPTSATEKNGDHSRLAGRAAIPTAR